MKFKCPVWENVVGSRIPSLSCQIICLYCECHIIGTLLAKFTKKSKAIYEWSSGFFVFWRGEGGVEHVLILHSEIWLRSFLWYCVFLYITFVIDCRMRILFLKNHCNTGKCFFRQQVPNYLSSDCCTNGVFLSQRFQSKEKQCLEKFWKYTTKGCQFSVIGTFFPL